MRAGLALVAAVLACAGMCMAADDPTTSLPGVLDLTPDTFDKHVTGGVHALVEFYAPWCGHCKRLTPEYKKLGEAIAADPKLKGRVVIAKVDADAHSSLGQRFGVRGFPTINWFARGKPVSEPSKYEGPRTTDAFLKFINEKLEADKGFARVDDLDVVATKFAAAGDKDARAAALAEAEAAVAKLEGDAKANGELYIKLMKKSVEAGKEALSKELARLERMMGSGSVAAEKMTEMSRKTSVLSAFLEGKEEEEAEE